jgi:hypothetical protein
MRRICSALAAGLDAPTSLVRLPFRCDARAFTASARMSARLFEEGRYSILARTDD